jgi:hypothetical protein
MAGFLGYFRNADDSPKSHELKCEVAPGDKTDAFSVAGASFQKTKVLNDGTELKARHKSHLSMFGVSISAAALYMDAKAPLSKGEDVMNPCVAKALEVHYMKGISAGQFRWVTEDTFSGNGFDGSSANEGLQKFNGLYQDMSHGDSYLLAYTPHATRDGSVTLSKNGAMLGSVTGNELSRAIFSVWFGKYVWFKSIRDDLLGLSGETL